MVRNFQSSEMNAVEGECQRKPLREKLPENFISLRRVYKENVAGKNSLEINLSEISEVTY
jgi:hypothetical protein